ncbi:MAG: DUF2330 domain-containing protein [Paracoccaceae bacterium]
MQPLRPLMSRLLLSFLLALAAAPAFAFCGFYVARADGSLYNRSSKIVFVRDGTRSVITMSSDYQCPVSDFAMIVPTPAVLPRKSVTTVPAKTVDHLDSYTAPRLVEYFDPDPCSAPVFEEAPVVEKACGIFGCGGGRDEKTRRDGARALGVRILSEYAVGIYDIQILSAKQSDGLVTFLTGEGYKLPEGAADALAGYIGMGMKFFVAKVNLTRHAAGKVQDVEPLQISFRSKDFMLPLQLGKLNGDGPQDLLVMTMTRKGRTTLANYTLDDVPTDKEIPVFVKDVFPDFYRAMFTRAAGDSGAFLEYAWDMAWCDPCADDPLSYQEFRALGVDWVSEAEASVPDVFVTRMHIRYGPDSFFQDLMFRETADRENFQGRYILNHPFKGEITCDAKDYIKAARERIRDEAATLRLLTGWDPDKIAQQIARTIPRRYR